jgi:peptidoglycan/xylan/chitin deacetylase (PgdA/CDA1 family)/glycosyltransferase involved in cell wall biosynthesis/predicted RNA methylase
VEALTSAGVIEDIICLRGPHEAEIQSFGNVTAYRLANGAGDKEGMRKYLWLSCKFTLLALCKLLALSVSHRYGAIQIHNMPDYLVFVAIFHKLLGRPVVLDLHDLTPELFASKWQNRKISLLQKIVCWAEKISCRFSDRLITTSTGFRNMLVARGVKPEKITLVLNAADDTIFTAPPRRQRQPGANGVTLLYHGTIARRFGLHLALHAIARLKGQIPEMKFLVHGKYDPRYRLELENLSRTFGLQELVFFKDFLSRDQVVEIIAAADIGVVPYLSDAFMNLALSTKVFEYVCMRLPIVAARIPSLTAIFDDDCIHYFRPGDATSLAEKILELFHHPELGIAKVEQAARSHQQVAWPVMANRYLALMTGLLNGSHGFTSLAMIPFPDFLSAVSEMVLVAAGAALLLLLFSYFILPLWVERYWRMKFCRRIRKSGSVCLSFDDGPNPEATPMILELLQQYGAKATFFVTGENVEKYPDLIERILEHGHEIAEHSYGHSHPWKSSPWRSWSDLKLGERAIKPYVRSRGLVLFRPPFGKMNLMTLLYVWRTKKQVVFWNIDPKDYQQPSGETVAQFVYDRLAKGAVILLHDGRRNAGTDTPAQRDGARLPVSRIGGQTTVTVSAAAALLATARQRGLALATIGTALSATSGQTRFDVKHAQIVRTLLSAARLFESAAGDWWLNVSTRGAVRMDPKIGKNGDARDFETVAHLAIHKVIGLIRPRSEDVIIVLGCGKGRAVCHFSRQSVRKVIGIELSARLCEVARSNSRRLRGRRAPIEIRNADAARAEMSEGTIFFMFNPFGEQTLHEVLANIENSRDLADSPVTIAYMNARHTNVFHNFSWLEIVRDYRRARGQRVVIYKNCLYASREHDDASRPCRTGGTAFLKEHHDNSESIIR